MGFIAFLFVLWVILTIAQPVGFILVGLFNFVKENWYYFIILAWFFRD